MRAPDRLPPRPDGADPVTVHVVVETPRGSAHKLAWDPALGAPRLRRVLSAGMHFPCDFGFVPGTRAPDGDPIDALLLLDAPTAPGVVAEARLVGVLMGEQTKGGVTRRNDRLLAVSPLDPRLGRARTLDDVGTHWVDAIARFLADYQHALGREFRVFGGADAEDAARLVDEAARAVRPR
ncbi:inorganic diphosphatase [Roseisolibacter sp. H3M3-2]|uniref:inorganic diphosphatase n=1 Tax=Roseisolibacter sp. H3M3-2 TaxID=3031323 RepID=UPI0023D99A34|nr:inorganic diphosphatase [Roseisolibacter sp. H3M3-2]MDF1502876.1 inorganic diphosphatase [Roseisolibacter sp. H3M3-2]